MDETLYQVVTVAMFVWLTTGGTAAYALVLTVMWKNKKDFSDSFSHLIWHLAIGDCGMLLCQYVVAIPLSATGRPLYGEGWLLILLASGDSLFFFFIWWWTFIVALGRFTTFFFTQSFIARIFDMHNRRRLVASGWLLGAAKAFFSDVVMECPKKFTHIHYHFYRDCSNSTVRYTPIGEMVAWFLNKQTLTVPIAMMVMYVGIFVKLRINSHRVNAQVQTTEAKRRMKRELSMLLQSFIICIVLFLEILLFNNIPWLFSTTCPVVGCEAASLLLGGIIILNCSINPYIFLLFNKKIRSKAEKLLCGKAITTAAQTTSMRSVRVANG